MNHAKPTVLIYGNCQAQWIANTFASKREIASRFDVIYIANYQRNPLADSLSDPGFIRQCSHLFWQTAAGCKPPAFVSTLPKQVRQVRFPTLCLKWLWPFHVLDPERVVKEPDFPDGRYPYGDRLLMKLLAESNDPQLVARRYVETDILKIINLDRYQEIAATELRLNDAQSDIQVANLVSNSFQKQHTFSTVNHPNPVILEKVMQAMANAILGHSLSPEIDPTDMSDILGHQEIPIHPQVAAHFKLDWYSTKPKWRYGAQQWSLTEYILAYALKTPVNFQEGPYLWSDRATLAAAAEDWPEAERLLLKGAALHPSHVGFFQSLGNLFCQRGKLVEAEKVYRFAISIFPEMASLHSDLGIVLFKRGFPDQAFIFFQTAVRLDPTYSGAAHNLALAAKAIRLRKMAAQVSQ